MILTCPECATRYFVDDGRLGQGRTVRCAACGSAWRAAAEEALVLTVSDEEGAVAGPAEALSFRPVEAADLSAPELPRAFRAAAEQRRRARAAAALGAVWTVLGCALAGLLAAAYLFRVDVVRLVPRTASAYALIGAPVNPVGLAFRSVKASGGQVPGQVAVTGQIVNLRAERVTAPPLRVSLVDAKGRTLSQRIAPSPATIPPLGSVPFSTLLPDPGARAADVAVAFALDVKGPVRAAPGPVRTAAAAPAAALRPAVGVEQAAETAMPLKASDPLALPPSEPLEPLPEPVDKADHEHR